MFINYIQILSVSEPVYNPLSQDQVDYIAKNMKIQYNILNNFAKYAFFSARLSLLNNGSVPISGGNWSIYLFHFSFIEPKYIKNNKSALVCENQFNITHVDGSLYTMSPTGAFVDILPGETREIILTNGNSMVARSDAFPNWYISAPQTIPRIIANTDDETLAFIGDFQSIEKWKRTSSDLFDPYTPEKRYFINADAHDFGQAKKLVIPTPLNLTRVEKVLDLNVDKWSIVFSDDLVMEAHILSGMCQTQVHWWRPIYCQVCIKHKSIDGVPYTVRYVSNTSLLMEAHILSGMCQTQVYWWRPIYCQVPYVSNTSLLMASHILSGMCQTQVHWWRPIYCQVPYVSNTSPLMAAHILSGMCQTQVHWWRPIYCQVCVKHKSIDGVPYTVRYVSNTSPLMASHILSGMCQTQVHWWRPIYCQVCVKHKSIDGGPYTVRYVSNTSLLMEAHILSGMCQTQVHIYL